MINPWYACLWQDVGDLLDPNYLKSLKMQVVERVRERETSTCIRISCYLEKYQLSVLKMILGDASRAHRLLHDNIIDALHAFYRMPKCLN